MPSSRDPGLLGQGGPSDQAAQRPDARDDPPQGSQSGRPQVPPTRPSDKPARERAASGEVDAWRGVSETERKAGTPDPRATNDGTQGEDGR